MSALDVFLLASLVATWGLGWLVYRRLQETMVSLTREHTEQREAQASIARIVGELQQTADELGEALATRASKLQKLLGDADARAAAAAELATRLEEAARQAQAADGGPRSTDRRRRTDDNGRSAPAGHHGRGVFKAREALGLLSGAPGAPWDAESGLHQEHYLAEVVSPDEPALAAQVPDTADEAVLGVGGARPATIEDMRRLAAQGLSPWEIAQRTHRGREEVRLLLELKEQHR